MTNQTKKTLISTPANQPHETAFFFIYLVGLEALKIIQSVKPEFLCEYKQT